MRLPFLLALLFSGTLALAQPNSFGIRYTNNNYDFVKVNPATGTSTVLSSLQGINGVVLAGSAINTVSGQYIFKGVGAGHASTLYALDTATGNVVQSAVLNNDLSGFEYNPTNNKLYALERQGQLFKMVTVNANGTINNMGTIGTIQGVVVDAHAIQPFQYKYFLIGVNGNQKRLMTISMFSGSVLSQPLLPNNMNLVALRYNCANNKLYALESNPQTQVMKLVSVDPTTGNTTTEVNLSSVNAYAMESASINSVANTYTFIGFQGSSKRLITIDLFTKTILHNQPLSINIAALDAPNSCFGYPGVDFQASVTNVTVGDDIDFTDLTTNGPTSWTWVFQGGSPSSALVQNPQNIQYNTPGCYKVKLTTTNANATGSAEKYCYIQVNPLTNPPVADFTANTTNVGLNTPVTFTDLSTQGPTTWEWSFPGGTPATFTGQNPGTVSYNTFGQFDVQLVVTNSSGSDTMFKPDYITVFDTNINLFIDFTVDTLAGYPGDTFQFTNLSSHQANCLWTFENSHATHSSDAHPSNVVFTEPGCHDITLQVTTSFTEESITKSCFIEINTPLANSVAELENEVGFNLFPNPAADEAQVTFDAVLNQPLITVYDFTGREVLSLQGNNTQQVTIPTRNLRSGMYLVAVTEGGKLLGTNKLVVR